MDEPDRSCPGDVVPLGEQGLPRRLKVSGAAGDWQTVSRGVSRWVPGI